MKEFANKLLIPLCLLSLTCGAGAVVKVYVQENDIKWIVSSLIRIEKKMENKCQ